MTNAPIDKMWERVEVARQDSDTSLFLALLYFGEMITKMTVAGMVAAVEEDRDRHQYRQLHKLVRAGGIGDWATVLEEITTGPSSQFLKESARQEQSELTAKCSKGSWQYETVYLMHKCVANIIPEYDKLPSKVNVIRWFTLFATLRNKTRGHGAPGSDMYCKSGGDFETSIRLLIDNFSLFKRPWAFLHRNLSGKYRVTKFTFPGDEFEPLKANSVGDNFRDGVYVFFDKPTNVELIHSDADALDFLFPNGAFNSQSYEAISYITNNIKNLDSSCYLLPTTPLPTSETQGIGVLDVQGKCFTNIPPSQQGYIERKQLENELTNALSNDRHPIITLFGRGGIGKTWLTLKVLHDITLKDRYSIILWFSSRDIDLMAQGPKPVKPHVLTMNDVALEFQRLVRPSEELGNNQAAEFLSKTMVKSEFGPILFVFDNFETVRAPTEVYSWIDTYIRPPNKILITTRMREFKGDYPLEVLGMNEDESTELIEATARTFGISGLLTTDYIKEVYMESVGHPYVMKILIGEVAKAGKLVKIQRIAATLDKILDALFERTYSGLSPVAQRLFLTLCCWRSAVPLIALEAVLLRPFNERMDVAGGAEELRLSSFIEIAESARDNVLFLTTPLVASIFGKRKLSTSPMRSAIESDVLMLRSFGAAQQSDIKLGLSPRVERLFQHVASRVSIGKESIQENLPMLEFIATKFPPAWLLIAKLYQENEFVRDSEKAKESIRRYIESIPDDIEGQENGWGQLASICQVTNDTLGEIHALVETCQLPGVSFMTITEAVNRVNSLFTKELFPVNTDVKQIVSQRLAQIMEGRIGEGNATDCSRLAWLYLRLDQEDKTKIIVQRGLFMEPDNIHCQNLLSRISKP